MIMVIVTYKDGEVCEYSHTLNYTIHLLGQLLIDPAVDHVVTRQHV